MNKEMKKGDHIQLDPLGNFFTIASRPENPGTFGIYTYLKERVDPDVLQTAVDDLLERLPYINVRMKSGFFDKYHEVMSEPLKITPAENFKVRCTVFDKKKEPVVRILYGENYFGIEVLHSVCDGRSLATIVATLTTHYFELKGVSSEKKDVIDIKGKCDAEEYANSFKEYADHKHFNYLKGVTSFKLTGTAAPLPYDVSYNFDLTKIKADAKKFGVTITEYLLGIFFMEISRERSRLGDDKPISIGVPIDCRQYYRSKSLRNFVTSTVVTVQNHGDFEDLLMQIHKSLKQADKKYIMGNINKMQLLTKYGKFMPLQLKKKIAVWLDNSVFRINTSTVMFSNIGYVKFPKEIQEKVEHIEGILCYEKRCPYKFCVISTGNVLTLTVTFSVKEKEIVNRIVSNIRKGECDLH